LQEAAGNRGICAGWRRHPKTNEATGAFHTTRSEIVVPMRNNDHQRILGMMDVESDKLNAFGEEDREFLERAGGLIAHCLH